MPVRAFQFIIIFITTTITTTAHCQDIPGHNPGTWAGARDPGPTTRPAEAVSSDRLDRQLVSPGAATPQPAVVTGGHSAIEMAFTASVLAFGAVIVGLLILVVLKRKGVWDDWSFKLVGLTIVVTAGLFLIVAGYTQDQTGPMMGLLGTVIGYILGKGGSSPSGDAQRLEQRP